MLTKKQVLERLKAIAKQLGWAPSVVEFEARSGISHYRVMQHFPTWSAAVKAAGLKPRRLRRIPRDEELLKNWGETVRRTGGVPTRHGYQVKGRYDPRTLEKRFGSWKWRRRSGSLRSGKRNGEMCWRSWRAKERTRRGGGGGRRALRGKKRRVREAED